MTTAATHLVRSLRRLTAPCDDSPDAELLERYTAARDGDAFALLVRRHGPMVLGVCRRLLGEQGAEDAFQATFLALASRPPTLWRPEALAGWLHGVARRIALKARRTDARRAARERTAAAPPALDPLEEISGRELVTALDEELQRLPEVYRLPLVLCCLEGRSQDEAARLLGWSAGSVKGRLERGRTRLQARLARRGLCPAAAFAAALLAPGLAPALPAALAESACGVATSPAAASPTVACLAQGAARGASTFRRLLATVLFVGLLGAGTALFALQGTYSAPVAPQAPAAKADGGDRQDRYGDPLPPGAFARLGTLRLRPGFRAEHVAFSPDGKRVACWSAGGGVEARFTLWAADGRPLRRVDFPAAKALAFTWLADGRGIAVVQQAGQSGNEAYVWEFTDEKAPPPPPAIAARRRPRFEEGGPHHFAVSPDGKLLAGAAGRAGDRTSPVWIWDLKPGGPLLQQKGLRVLGRHPNRCRTLAFTAGGRSILVLSHIKERGDETLTVLDVASGERRRELTVPPGTDLGPLKAYAVSPDGRTLALGMEDGTARLWDLTTGKEKHTLAVSPAKAGRGALAVSALAFSPDGTRLATSGRDQTVRVHDLEGGRQPLVMPAHESWVEAVAFSRDGKRVASAGQDGLIRLWDAATGADSCPLGGHRFWIWGATLSGDGKTAATVGMDGTARLWEVETGRETRRFTIGTRATGAVVFLDGDRRLAFVADDRLGLRDLETGKAITIQGPLAAARCRFFWFLPGGKEVLTAEADRVALWQWPAGQLVRTFEKPASPEPAKTHGWIALALSPDGKVLAAARNRPWDAQMPGPRSTVDLWETRSGRHLWRVEPSCNAVYFLRFTPDGTGLFVGGSAAVPVNVKEAGRELDGALALLDVNSGKTRRTFAGPDEAKPGGRRTIRGLALSADGRTIAVGEGRGDEDGRVLLYEATTGLRRRQLDGHRAGVTSLAFTPDGRRLVTASFDNTGLVWGVSLAELAAEAPAEAERLWAGLAATESVAARRALAGLARNPEAAVTLLGKRLRPAVGLDRARLDRLVADLDSPQFTVREKASAELERLGGAAVRGLRERMGKVKGLEARRRLERVLEKHDVPAVAPERLRELRAVEVLEHLATPAARRILEELAGGAAEAELTAAAGDALRRLGRR